MLSFNKIQIIRKKQLHQIEFPSYFATTFVQRIDTYVMVNMILLQVDAVLKISRVQNAVADDGEKNDHPDWMSRLKRTTVEIDE